MPRTACVIDDDPDIVTLAAQVLSKEGLAAEEFVDPARFQERILADRVDLAVIDLVMPKIDGYDLAMWLRRASPYTRIILMTGCAEADILLDCWSLGCDACVLKSKNFIRSLRDAALRSIDAHESWHQSVTSVRAGYRV